MNAIRKILMPLLIIPLWMFIYILTHPDWQEESAGLELLFMGIGIPILLVSLLVWFYPEIVKAYFPLREDWGAQGNMLVALAVAGSALAACLCVGIGVASTIASLPARPAVRSSTLQPGLATALARSKESQATLTNLGETDLAPAPKLLPGTNLPPTQNFQTPGMEVSPAQAFQVPETGIPPEQTLPGTDMPGGPTPQIPVSGGGKYSSPTFASTQTTVTGTAGAAGLCTRARQDDVNTLLESVQEVDAEYTVGVVWAVQSSGTANLWLLAAKVSGPDIAAGTPPGVWALLIDSAGSRTLYALNDSATQYSGADAGADLEPPLSMQSAGAQTAYNCAAQAS